MAFGLTPVHLFLILMILVVEVGIPILLIVFVVRYLVGRNRPDPSAVLAGRLARGEITREQFDTAMQALGLGGPANPPGPTSAGPISADASRQSGPTNWGGPSGPTPPPRA